MRYALIGCGRIAPNHIKAAKENGFEIVGVCDIDSDRISEMFAESILSEEEYRNIPRFSDYRSMIDEVRPELVSIALPSGLHAQCAVFVIEKGIHCIIEKPIAMSIKDADRIVALSEEKNVVVSACHQNRFNTAVQEMRGALESGMFGKLSHAAITVRWHRDRSYYEQADWRGKWASDGGTLMNQCIHGIDLLRWMCGDEIESVYGITNNVFHPYIEAEDVGTAVIKFKNGCIATVEGTVNVNGSNLEEHLSLFGENGCVKLGGICANTVEHWSFNDGSAASKAGIAEHTLNVYGNGHTSLFRDVADAIKEHRAPYVDARAGRNALETVLAVYKSSHDGAPVKFPLTDVSSADFEGTRW